MSDATSHSQAPVPARTYAAFGHGLSSTVDLPELRPARNTPVHWTFGLMTAEERSSGGELLGVEPLYRDVSARLYRHEEGSRIEVDDTGVYDISADGETIRWLPNPDPWWDFGRGHLLGRVLSTSMHFSGLLVLHGSAVETAQGTIAFLGVKGSGKTTLALAMVEQGARLVTDDTLPIVPERLLAWPGIHSLRLVPGTTPSNAAATTGRDGKIVTPPLSGDLVAAAPTPLRAIYVVEPAVSLDPDTVVGRTALDPLRATAALAAHAKIGTMLGSGEAETLLDRAAAVAAKLPVRVLAVHRDSSRIPEVALRTMDWHGGPAERETGTP